MCYAHSKSKTVQERTRKVSKSFGRNPKTHLDTLRIHKWFAYSTPRLCKLLAIVFSFGWSERHALTLKYATWNHSEENSLLARSPHHTEQPSRPISFVNATLGRPHLNVEWWRISFTTTRDVKHLSCFFFRHIYTLIQSCAATNNCSSCVCVFMCVDLVVQRQRWSSSALAFVFHRVTSITGSTMSHRAHWIMLYSSSSSILRQKRDYWNCTDEKLYILEQHDFLAL